MSYGHQELLSHRPEIGYFRNPDPGHGWSSTFSHLERRGIIPFRWTVEVMQFRLHPHHPLTYVDQRTGWEYQPDRKAYRFDGGSIPPPVRWMPSYHPLRYPRAYGFHDSGYSETDNVPGREGEKLHGLWVRKPGETVFAFVELPRAQVDHLLNDMARVEGADDMQGRILERTCQWFGPRW